MKRGQPIAPRIEAIITAVSPNWITRNAIAARLGRPISDYRGVAILNPADITALNKLVDQGVVERRFSYSKDSGVTRINYEYRLKALKGE